MVMAPDPTRSGALRAAARKAAKRHRIAVATDSQQA
jgi:hypothetical protein